MMNQIQESTEACKAAHISIWRHLIFEPMPRGKVSLVIEEPGNIVSTSQPLELDSTIQMVI